MKTLATLIALVLFTAANGQNRRAEVMTLGTFHFSFPNLDRVQIAKSNQIDVLDTRRQKEIAAIVEKIARFRPTIIVIERQPSYQSKTDSAYNSYLEGKHQLKRNEEEQIGFRLARRLGLKKLYCVDEWGTFTEATEKMVFGKDSVAAARFEKYFEDDPDSAWKYYSKPVFATKGILAELKQLNDEENIKRTLGNYLVGVFNFELQPNDFRGVDFETGRWFSRNLKILRNIERISFTPADRILVIFGAAHLNLLNYFFDCSPKFHRVKTLSYLN